MNADIDTLTHTRSPETLKPYVLYPKLYDSLKSASFRHGGAGRNHAATSGDDAES